jgi:DMSO/TMAO reductase YedYZ molybdopterin-dependent catalytic subunit
MRSRTRLLALLVFVAAARAPYAEPAEEAILSPTAPPVTASSSAASTYPEYLSLADGLHVTGTPIEVDAATYRLKVGGLVATPLALSLDEVRSMPAERLLMSLTCPGFFTDTGYWTGVRVAEVLKRAGYRADASRVHEHRRELQPEPPGHLGARSELSDCVPVRRPGLPGLPRLSSASGRRIHAGSDLGEVARIDHGEVSQEGASVP